MPLFFYIAGMSSTFYDSEKNGYLKFVKNKSVRLLLPLFGAILVLLIPRLYLSQEYEAWTRVDDKIENNFFLYTWSVLPSIPAKLSWLWFLIVLFVIMLLNYPLMAWSKRRTAQKQYDRSSDGKLILMLSVTLSVWIILLCLAVSRDDVFGYLIPATGVLASFYAVMFAI